MKAKEIIAEIGKLSGDHKQSVIDILDALHVVMVKEVRETGQFVFPRQVGLTVKFKKIPAKPARKGRNPATGEAISIPAKPESKKVVCKVLPTTQKEMLAPK